MGSQSMLPRALSSWLFRALIAALALGFVAGEAPSFADDDVPPLPPELGGPPSPSVGTDISDTYLGPFPSEVDKNLVGPVQLLRSGTLNDDGTAITLPLYKGHLRREWAQIGL